LVTSNPESRLVLGSGVAETLFFNYKFAVTQEMKTNGIAVMVIPNVAYTLTNSIIQIEKASKVS